MNTEKLLELYIEYLGYLNSITYNHDYGDEGKILKIQESLFDRINELKRLMLLINPNNEFAYDRHEVE